MQIFNSLKIKSFTYDVVRDGGLVGTVLSGLFLPGKSFSGFFFAWKAPTAFTANAGALCSFGTTGAPAAFLPATDLTLIPANVWTGANAFYTVADPGEEVMMTITVAAYLTGVIEFSIICIETSL